MDFVELGFKDVLYHVEVFLKRTLCEQLYVYFVLYRYYLKVCHSLIPI